MKKNKSARRRKIKVSGSERRLKICAVVISLLFTVLMLYPLVFSISSSMKDNSQIYEIPPRLLPNRANSLTLTIDYTGMDFADEAALKDAVMQDNILAMFGINYKMADQSIMEIHVYATRDGKTIFHSRAHQMKLQMERDYGIYKSSAVKKKSFSTGIVTYGPVIPSVIPSGQTASGPISRRHRSQSFSIRYPASWQKNMPLPAR